MTEPTTAIMNEANVTAINGAFTTASGNMMTTFVDLLPTMLIIAVAGFGVYTTYKLIKKVRKGGK